ncbi:MAG: hypothetical protein WC663_02110 [Patescibacteria group bacterium]|jgi:hypothetical protein
MPEREPLTQQDIQGPEKESEKIGLEIARTPESETVKDLANEFHEAIQNDSPITYGKVEDFREALGKLKFNIGGEMMTAEEVKKIPDLKMNMEIWEEIRRRDYRRVRELTFIIPDIYHIISQTGRVFSLEKIDSLPDEIALLFLDFSFQVKISDNFKKHLTELYIKRSNKS